MMCRGTNLSPSWSLTFSSSSSTSLFCSTCTLKSDWSSTGSKSHALPSSVSASRVRKKSTTTQASLYSSNPKETDQLCCTQSRSVWSQPCDCIEWYQFHRPSQHCSYTLLLSDPYLHIPHVSLKLLISNQSKICSWYSRCMLMIQFRAAKLV